MKAYALDLRERLVKFIQVGGSKAEAARRFDVARSSVYRYLAAAPKGALPPKASWGTWRKLDPQKLQAHVRKHPDATLKELQTVFGVSHHAVWVRLGQLGFTLKKLIKYRERNEVQRWLFRRELESSRRKYAASHHLGNNIVTPVRVCQPNPHWECAHSPFPLRSSGQLTRRRRK